MSRRALFVVVTLALASPAAAQELPDRPEKIEYPPLTFEPPNPAAFRHELPGGVVAYLAPSKELPLVDVTFTFKGGRYLDPADAVGLAAATAAMMRRGGAGDLGAEAFDERADFLAAQLGVSAGDYRISADLNCLSSELEPALGLFLDMLRRPRFEAERLAVYRDELLEQFKQRNDDAGDILEREWAKLLYGDDHFKGWFTTGPMLARFTPEAMNAFRARVMHPGNLVIAVTGDFELEAMKKRLGQALSGWEAGEAPADPPAPAHALKPAVYRVEKDIPQGKVVLGMRSIQRDDPDFFPLQVMSRILGSGGFTSRIMNRVRTEEGLAYSAGAYVIPGLYFPGEFRAFFQSKSRTCALAIQLIREEIERIRKEPVSDEELSTAKGSIVEAFPGSFGDKAKTLSVFVDDHLTGRPFAYWQSYRDKVEAVTTDDVLRVAKEHLDPAKMAILVVGKWDDVAAGDLEGRASMKAFFGGESAALPLRDPVTLEAK